MVTEELCTLGLFEYAAVVLGTKRERHSCYWYTQPQIVRNNSNSGSRISETSHYFELSPLTYVFTFTMFFDAVLCRMN